MALFSNRPIGPGVSAARVLTEIVGTVSAWNDARVTRKSLSSLSNHELDDLGLNRGDIDDIAKSSPFRR